MYHLGYTSGQHTSIDNLPKSCPAELRPFFEEAIGDLMRERLLLKKPTSYGPQVTAAINPTGFDYANRYRRKYGLQEEEYGKPPRAERAEPLTPEELRKLKFRKK
jgi:hypothetical protein